MVLESLSKPDFNTDYENLVILRDITSPHDEIWICAREVRVLLKKGHSAVQNLPHLESYLLNFGLKDLKGYDWGLQQATLS